MSLDRVPAGKDVPRDCNVIIDTPRTLSDDGDPCDVLVLSAMPLITGVVLRYRPIGMLKLDDEAGGDAKILAVPIDKLSSLYGEVRSHRDLESIERYATAGAKPGH